MRVAVYGAGGVGAYFGGRLAASGCEVHLIARGSHLEALRVNGLEIESIHGDLRLDLPATDDPVQIGPCDYVLFTVKSYDTEGAAAQLEPLISADTAVISLQNGIDNEDKIGQAIGREHVMGGVAYIFSTLGEPGVVQHTGGPARIIFGELDGRRSARAERFLEACLEAEIDAELSEDIRAVLWTKYSFICAHSGLTAAIGLPIGEIRAIPECRDLFRRMVEEARAVASAEDVDLPDDLADRHLAFADGLEADSYSSLHYDMSHGKRMELEGLHGTLVRRAERHGLEVPVTRVVHALLLPFARTRG